MRRPYAAAVSLSVFLLAGAVAIGVQQLPAASAPAVASEVDGAATVVASGQRSEQEEDLPNEADMIFATMMAPHHEQAIELARILAATPGVGLVSTGLAGSIERDQAAEIAQMRAWLDAWHQVGIMDHDHGHGATMSGMATPEQIAGLDALSGQAAERRFLELMIAHHTGALEMARTAIAEGTNSFIRTLAKHIAAEQQREIEAMTARIGVL